MSVIQVAEALEAPPIRRRQPLFLKKTVRHALPWLVIGLLFLLWEIAVRTFAIPEFVLPAPSAIFAAAWEFRAGILDNAWQTFLRPSSVLSLP